MKYGAIADNELERRMLGTARGPRPVLDALVSLVQAKSLMLSVRLGIFDKLASGPATAARLAAACDVDHEMLDLILRMLWGSGYLERVDRMYNVTALARGALLRTSPASRASHTTMCELFWDAIGNMESALRTGRGVDPHVYLRTPAAWQIYQAAMLENARIAAPLISSLIPVRDGARTLLDLGGSHGLFGAFICRSHPPMTSEVIELPAAVEQAAELAFHAGLDDVVRHRAGDVLTMDLDSNRDVILINNVLHYFHPQQIAQLLQRARRALAASGTLAIFEFEPPTDVDAPDALRDGGALFFRTISPTRCHHADEYSAWLSQAGFIDIRVRRLPALTQQVVLTARQC